MPEGAAIGGLLLCALFIGLSIETLIGAVFLRAAVNLYNKMAGGASSPGSVPEPAFGKAMWIIFGSTVFQMVVGGLVIGISTDAGPVASGAGGKGVDFVAQLLSFPVGLLIMAGVLSAKLPTTFGRAILVALCYLLVALLVVGALVGIAVLVFGVTTGAGWGPPATSKG
jgi:hypothetical protein